MKYSTERTVKLTLRGEEYTAKLVMIPLRVKLSLTDDDGTFDTLRYFEQSVPEVSGPEVNGNDITCGADVLDAPGADDLFTQLMTELREWDVGEEESKNS